MPELGVGKSIKKIIVTKVYNAFWNKKFKAGLLFPRRGIPE